MARGTSLQNLLEMLKQESGRSASVAAGTDAVDAMKNLLRRTQATLYFDYEWPHLLTMPTKTIAAGQRYYDMPTGLNLDRITDVRFYYGGDPLPLTRGISFDEYAQYDSADDERADPIQRWDLRRTSATATQIEVWPLPATNATNGLQFRGLYSLAALTDLAHVAMLDDDLIVLYAAAEILAGLKKEDAGVKLNAANKHYWNIKKALTGASDDAIMSRGPVSSWRRPASNIVVGA